MRYLSLFSGIEAATAAWEPLGWDPMAFAEVDDFPSAILAHRYPDVPNLGDVCEVDWRKFVEDYGRPDVLIGGSPCQSFSIAGGRDSLGGASRLMFEYIRAAREVQPDWIVWENVPGVLSVRDDAFGQLLEELQDAGYESLAWRVLDAQFFGVAQRRRRVFLVGHLGAGGGAPAVLVEPESMCGNSQASRQKREELAADARERADERVGKGDVTAFKYSAGAAARTMPTYDDGSCNTLTADWHSPAIAFSQNTRNEVRLIGGTGDHVGALASQPSPKGQGGALIAQPATMCVASNAANAEICDDVSPTLLSRQYKDPPYIVDVSQDSPQATTRKSSRLCARQTGTSSSSTTSPSTEGDSSLTEDGFDEPICVADDNANSAIDVNLAGTLKIGGGYVRSYASNGQDVISALCARDHKGVSSQYLTDGKVICQMVTTDA